MFWFNLPSKLCCLVQLTHNTICYFCFSIHKLNFNLKLYRVVMYIIIYIRKMYYEFFIITFYIILYLNDKLPYQNNDEHFMIYFFNMPRVVGYHPAKFQLKTSLVYGEIKKTNCVKR